MCQLFRPEGFDKILVVHLTANGFNQRVANHLRIVFRRQVFANLHGIGSLIDHRGDENARPLMDCTAAGGGSVGV